MAFAYTTNGQVGSVGNFKMVSGAFTNSSSSGGDITTGLNFVAAFGSMATSHVGTLVPKYTLVTATGVVTIVTDDEENGNWWAIGI